MLGGMNNNTMKVRAIIGNRVVHCNSADLAQISATYGAYLHKDSLPEKNGVKLVNIFPGGRDINYKALEAMRSQGRVRVTKRNGTSSL